MKKYRKYSDAILTQQSRAYTKFINQADYRGEACSITIEQWFALWRDLWPQRGRRSGDLCISRIDWDEPWQLDNVEIITRTEHLGKKNYKTLGMI